ncbi:MAG: 3-hydroxyacyl-CoA dehydrogenase family protein, partial [Granulosicoccus sp.]|nr:3-hydroxyacyl-CoA dehydrogenase family protein [Granulosicoccus sp.]
LEIKQSLFTRLDTVRKKGSIVTSNTSGIPLRDICQGQSTAMNADIAVTHFFNPVHIMRLLELVPGEHTDPEVIQTLADFFSGKLNKGVVYAKDTVNFIGNRIGCFWILAGLHKGIKAQRNGLTMETIDALLSKPIGLPPTGLYGLVDLIGLDIMDHVSANLRGNLPPKDACYAYLDFPPAEQKMMAEGQLGRKSGGGYYRLDRHDDGSKTLNVFDLDGSKWREAEPTSQSTGQADYRSLMLDESDEGRFVWALMSETLCYAADLVPDIADDIVNIDRAMRWGFNWTEGPFEMIDGIGATVFAEKLMNENRSIPKMLAKLLDSGASSFYRDDTFFNVNGDYVSIPAQ